jgi:N-acetylglucosaminyldiphosphoundecaprenol N-acetyl-beta-D-mannosaminyltransferase
MNTNRLFNISFFNESKDVLINQYIHEYIDSDQKSELKVIFTPNPEQIMLAKRSANFAEVLRAGDIAVPDGVGVMWAARILNMVGKSKILKSRITGIDVMKEVIEQFPQVKMAVIGGRSEVHGNKPHMVTLLGKHIPRLSGYKDVHKPTPQEEESVKEFLRKNKPKVLFVAFGAPYQEEWIITHKAFLTKQGVKVAMVVGGAVDVLSGKLQRAPSWIRTLGFEWLYRLVQEPWRWKRQLQLIHFIGLTFKEALR